jgi:hypothetical protein
MGGEEQPVLLKQWHYVGIGNWKQPYFERTNRCGKNRDQEEMTRDDHAAGKEQTAPSYVAPPGSMGHVVA